MALYENGSVKIYYEEAGSGFPLLVIPGGGIKCEYCLSVRTDAVQPDEHLERPVPLHNHGPAQRQWRPVLRPGGGRSAMGFLYR